MNYCQHDYSLLSFLPGLWIGYSWAIPAILASSRRKVIEIRWEKHKGIKKTKFLSDCSTTSTTANHFEVSLNKRFLYYYVFLLSFISFLTIINSSSSKRSKHIIFSLSLFFFFLLLTFSYSTHSLYCPKYNLLNEKQITF